MTDTFDEHRRKQAEFVESQESWYAIMKARIALMLRDPDPTKRIMVEVGSTRRVFLIGKYAIKTPRCSQPRWEFLLKGLCGNINERALGRGEGKNPHLCPVLWCSWGGWILVMPRARVCTDDEYESFGRMEAFKNPMIDHWVSDKARSWGWVDKDLTPQLVAIDYGSPKERDDKRVFPELFK